VLSWEALVFGDLATQDRLMRFAGHLGGIADSE